MSARFPPLTPVIRVAAALTFASMAGTAGFLLGRYPLLTRFLPVHFGRMDMPDRWRAKSLSLVLMPFWVQIALTLALGAIAVILLWRAAPRAGQPDGVPSGSREEDAERMIAVAEAVALLLLVWVAFQAFAAVEVVDLWQRGWGGLGRAYAAGLLTGVALSAAIGVYTMVRIGRPPARGWDEGPHWRLRHLYFNPADPALFVPDRRGAGWTLNFGRPAAVVLIAFVILFGVGAPWFIIRSLVR